MGVTAVFAFATVASQQAQASSQKKALRGQAATAEYNAEIAQVNAENALLSSSSNQLQLRREQRQFFGTQRAIAAQSGAGPGGSNRDIIEQSEDVAELDALNLAYEGELKAHGYMTQSDVDSLTARMYQSQVSGVNRAAMYSTIGTIAGTYGKYKGYL